MSEHRTHHAQQGSIGGQRLLAGALITSGTAFLVTASFANLLQSTSFAQTDEGRLIYGGASIGVDWLLVLLSIVTGVLFRDGKWGAGLCVAVFLAVFAASSLLTFYGFGVTQRVAPMQAEVARHSALLETIAEAAAEAKRRRNEHLGWVQAQVEQAATMAADAKQPRHRREEARRAGEALHRILEDHALKPVEVQSTPVPSIRDPGAAALADGLGWDVATVQKVQTLHLGILLIVGGMLAIVMGVVIWPKCLVQEANQATLMAEGADYRELTLSDRSLQSGEAEAKRSLASTQLLERKNPSDELPVVPIVRSVTKRRPDPTEPIAAANTPVSVRPLESRTQPHHQRLARTRRSTNQPRPAVTVSQPAQAPQQGSQPSKEVVLPAVDQLPERVCRQPVQRPTAVHQAQDNRRADEKQSHLRLIIVGHATVAANLVAMSPYAPPVWVLTALLGLVIVLQGLWTAVRTAGGLLASSMEEWRNRGARAQLPVSATLSGPGPWTCSQTGD